MEYQKLKVKKFANKSFKHSQDGNYWKKFKTVYANLEKGFMTSDVSFCTPQDIFKEIDSSQVQDSNSLLATATGSSVDIWKLQQLEQKEENNDQESDDGHMIQSYQRLTRFSEQITAVKLREDGQVILAGDRLGKIELIELKQKMVLRTYENEHKNQINSFDFSSTRRSFVSCSNETSWKYFDIQYNKGSVFTCQAAHSDNIKQVLFIPGTDNLVISAGQDKYIKLWSLDTEKLNQFFQSKQIEHEDYYQLQSQIKLNEPIENFCFGKYKEHLLIFVSNGNLITIVELTNKDGEKFSKDMDESKYQLKVIQTIHAFQKPIMKVDFDIQRQRVIAGGLDQQLKFFEIFLEDNENSDISKLQLRLQYKIKFQNPIFQFKISHDGNHYVSGLVDGSLLIKSKKLEAFKKEYDDEMKMIMNAFQPSFKSTSKSYKYFYRGQYGVLPDPEDIIGGMTKQKQKLQQYEKLLKKFEYRKALNHAIEMNNPEVLLSLIEELIQRGGLEIALSNRSPDELMKLIQFIKWKICDYRYQHVLVQLLRFIIDMYYSVLTSQNPQINVEHSELIKIFTDDLRWILKNEIEVEQNLIELQGQIQMISSLSQILKSYKQ